MLPGDDEARLTFLAVRRWFGWSSGRLAVFDIGGGSLEIAVGADEAPDVAQSLPLGAGRLTRDWLPRPAPTPDAVRALRKHVRAEIARDARRGAPGRRPRPRGRHLARRSARWPGSAARRRRARARSYAGCWTPTALADGIPKLLEMTADGARGPARGLAEPVATSCSPAPWSPTR